MLRKRYVFLSSSNVVVQVIVGDLDANQVASFLATYRGFFGAESVVEITDEETAIWIGGSYDATSGEFSPPPSPEPEVIVEETMNDDAPII